VGITVDILLELQLRTALKISQIPVTPGWAKVKFGEDTASLCSLKFPYKGSKWLP